MRVFIDYRREDSAGYAGRLSDHLKQELGADHVLMDVDTVAPGVDFMEAIRDQLAKADAYIALIGLSWSTEIRSAGRRLDNSHDYLRATLTIALQSGIPVIPVLVDGGQMPAEAELPEDVRGLARQSAVELSDTRWEYDVARLASLLKSLGDDETTDPAS